MPRASQTPWLTADRGLRALLIVGATLVTVVQILRPGVNQDVRYVVGALGATAAAGFDWSEAWAHRPLAARAVLALLTALSPGQFRAEEIGIRFWSILLATGAAVVLWIGLRRRLSATVAGWSALAVGAALAWAPGWDFAEPEWYATVLAAAAIGLALRQRKGAAAAGGLLGLVVCLKFTTAATALAALVVVGAIDARQGRRTALSTALAAPSLFAVTVLIEAREWQWLWDMPTLNPPLRIGALDEVAEGLVNSAVVSPITVVGLIAVARLLLRGGRDRRMGWLALVALGLLAVPFVGQQQNFLYHLTAVPVAAAALVAAVGARAARTPLALPAAGVLALIIATGLFRVGPRTRTQEWWIAQIAVLVILAAGVAALLVELRRGDRGPREDSVTRRALRTAGIGGACLAPLLVTVSPLTTYSFSLAHNRTTAAGNTQQAQEGSARRARVNRALPADAQVVYLSFSAAYWLGNPTPCRYASPTFLVRATGTRGAAVAATQSYAENLACLSNGQARAVVIEPAWFKLDQIRPEIRTALSANFDCRRPLYEGDGWLICRRR